MGHVLTASVILRDQRVIITTVIVKRIIHQSMDQLVRQQVCMNFSKSDIQSVVPCTITLNL